MSKMQIRGERLILKYSKSRKPKSPKPEINGLDSSIRVQGQPTAPPPKPAKPSIHSFLQIATNQNPVNFKEWADPDAGECVYKGFKGSEGREGRQGREGREGRQGREGR